MNIIAYIYAIFYPMLFLYCKELRSHFISFDDCIKTCCFKLKEYKIPAEPYYSSLSESEKEILLDEYLTYCQVVLTCLSYLKENADQILSKYFSDGINDKVITQFTELITSGLKSFNYKRVLIGKSLNAEIIMDNPVAEVIASESSRDVSEAIMGFLGNRDIKIKEKYLHDFIDFLEPTIKKYSDQPTVKKIKEYVQLLRHPEIKKEEKEFKWYFNNKRKNLDKLFELCLFVQQYDLSKSIINEFEDNKKISA